MALYEKPDSRFFWTDVTVGGVRVRKSTKKTVRAHALKFEAALIHKLSTGEISDVRQKAPILADFAPTFLEHVIEGRLDPDTKSYYRNGWRLLSTQHVARMRLDNITTSTADLLKIPGSGSNVNCAIRTLRKMLSLAAEMRFIVSAPRFHLAKEKRRERLITPMEETLIIEKGNETTKDAFMIMMDTGARPNEIAAIAWSNVDFVRRAILIPEGKTANARRWLAMTDRVFELLKRRAAKSNLWVFPSPRRPGQHLDHRSLIIMFGELKRRIGLDKDVVFYSARHTFGTDFQEAVKDLSKTSRQLGHGSLAVTQRYLHPETVANADAMNRRNAQRHVLSHSKLKDASVQ